MKTNPLLIALFISALGFSLQATAADKEVLLDEHFENPDSATHYFPPKSGEAFAYSLTSGSSPVGGWSEKGQVAVTYAEKIGTKNSGGLNCKLELAGGLYAQATIEAIPVPEVENDATRISDAVTAMKVSFAAKIPDGEEVEVSLAPTIPAGVAGDGYTNRIVFPPLKGTGKYETYALAVRDLPSEKVDGFITVLKNVSSAAGKGSFTLTLKLGKQWPQGASFQLDDVLVTIEK